MKNIFWKKCHTSYLLYIGIGIIGIVIGRYEKFHIGILSVSADKKIPFIGLYRYRPIWKKAYRLYTAVGKSLFHKRVLFQLLHLDTSYIQIFQKYSNKIFAPLCKKPYFAHPIFYLNICNDDGCKIK